MATHCLDIWKTPFGEALSKIIPPECRRAIIDINYDDAVQVYYHCYADDKLLELNWENALSGAEVISAENTKGQEQKANGQWPQMQMAEEALREEIRDAEASLRGWRRLRRTPAQKACAWAEHQAMCDKKPDGIFPCSCEWGVIQGYKAMAEKSEKKIKLLKQALGVIAEVKG